jgi:formylglycine-generating enzyme required for sulfatase activity/beta-lactamase regulating signal transducer with metallopeptidase domain
MNTLHAFLLSPLVERLGWGLLHFLWEGAVIAALLAVALRILRNRSPNARYLAAWVALLAMACAVPLSAWLVTASPTPTVIAAAAAAADPPADTLTNLMAPARIDAVQKWPQHEQQEAVLPPTTDLAAQRVVESRPAANEALAARLSLTLRPALPWLVGGWLAGALVLALWHLGGWWQLGRLRRVGAREAPDTAQQMLADLLRRFAVRAPVKLLVSARVAVPTLIGWLRPVILVPASVLAGLPPQQLELILAHELAHLRRCDYLLNLVQTAIETLLLYHPAVWWVSRQIRVERESCCDEQAAAAAGDRLLYARALTSLAELCRQPPRLASSGLALGADGGSLSARIRRVLELPARDRVASPAWLGGGLAALVLIAAMAGAMALGGDKAGKAADREAVAETAGAPHQKPAPRVTNSGDSPWANDPDWPQWLCYDRWSWLDKNRSAPKGNWQDIFVRARNANRGDTKEDQQAYLGELQSALDAQLPRAGELDIRMAIGDAMVLNFTNKLNEEAVAWYAQIVDRFKDMPGHTQVMLARIRLAETVHTRKDRERHRPLFTGLLRGVIETPDGSVSISTADGRFLIPDEIPRARMPAAEHDRLARDSDLAKQMDQLERLYRETLAKDRAIRIVFLHRGAADILARGQYVEGNLQQTRINLLELKKLRPSDQAFQDAVDDYLKDIEAELGGQVAIALRTAEKLTAAAATGKPAADKQVSETPPGEAKGPPKELTVDLGGGVKMEMVLIPAGEFMMGSPDSDTGDLDKGDRSYRVMGNEKPQHRVRITKPFYLGKYEVTQEQWEAVMGSNPSYHKGPKKPVEKVSWDDCQQFLSKLNAKLGDHGGKFRLPTEAQWEYACRAGSTTRFCFGDEQSGLGQYAWYNGNSQDRNSGYCGPYPVGGKKPNAWGLHDMHGNVSEWCADYLELNYQVGRQYYATSPTDDPTGAATGSRVSRGGACAGDAGNCRSARRLGYSPEDRDPYVGLRVSRGNQVGG